MHEEEKSFPSTCVSLMKNIRRICGLRVVLRGSGGSWKDHWPGSWQKILKEAAAMS